jgi:hypothetical protein
MTRSCISSPQQSCVPTHRHTSGQFITPYRRLIQSLSRMPMPNRADANPGSQYRTRSRQDAHFTQVFRLTEHGAVHVNWARSARVSTDVGPRLVSQSGGVSRSPRTDSSCSSQPVALASARCVTRGSYQSAWSRRRRPGTASHETRAVVRAHVSALRETESEHDPPTGGGGGGGSTTSELGSPTGPHQPRSSRTRRASRRPPPRTAAREFPSPNADDFPEPRTASGDRPPAPHRGSRGQRAP